MIADSIYFNEPWNKTSFIVLDLEGTGSQHKEKEGIVEIAAIEIKQKQLTSNYFYQLLNPQIDIPPRISGIHGLKNKDVDDKPIFDIIKLELLQFINNKILVGHNVGVDYRLLKLKMPNYVPTLILDTRKLSKHFFKTEQKHRLDDLIERFEIRNQLTNLPIKRNRHSAFYDAYATGTIFLQILTEKFPKQVSLRQIANLCSINFESKNQYQTTLF